MQYNNKKYERFLLVADGIRDGASMKHLSHDAD